ncbi:MAG TPA: hypothetical protein DEP28_09155 [Bacteroidetes bacterium]|nr:hypothetical protein [Bacteroidota bacterium]HCN36896.1 hypothetical protein [Bacteroidota bacterium]
MTNSEFKKVAREHQIRYREENIGTGYNKYTTWLTDEDAKIGKNFCDGFSIFQEVKKRYPNFKVGLYSDMLRSEHIPFNLFVPFRYDLNFCKNVFNEFLGGCIKSVDEKSILDNNENIKIEFAPSPKGNYLNDSTSFDSYIEYTHHDNSKGIIGVEVKYTEKEYPLKKGSRQDININDNASNYYKVSELCELYDSKSYDNLKKDLYRQIWRNQLLAESICLVHKDKIKYSSSMIFYPDGNEHFTETGNNYIAMLKNNENKLVLVTYEKFLSACKKHCPDKKFKTWIDYLAKRYIPII